MTQEHTLERCIVTPTARFPQLDRATTADAVHRAHTEPSTASWPR